MSNDKVRRHPGRTFSTHLKATLPPGTEGKQPFVGEDTIDWPAILHALYSVGGTRWIILEQEEYPDGISQLDAVRRSKDGLDIFLQQKP